MMKKYIFFCLAILICISLNSCYLSLLLTKNKVKIPDSLEGVWQSVDDLYEFRKKDNYWAFCKKLKDNPENIVLDITLHSFNGILFTSFSSWEKNKRGGFVFALEINNDKKITIYPVRIINDKDRDDFQKTPASLKEVVFESYLKNGKIKIDKQKKDDIVVMNKIYSLKK